MHLCHRPGIAVREVEGETIILDREGGQVHTLNETAALVWSLCDGTRSVEEVGASLAERFEVEREVAERDSAALMMQLQELGLLVEKNL